VHSFANFEKSENGKIYTVRDATVHSVNLSYVRLMRDLVRYYQARLPYDTDAILADTNYPMRHRLLQEIADEESRFFLFRAYKSFEKRSTEDVIAQLLGKKAKSDRQISILFYAWHHGADEELLTRWLVKYHGIATPEQTQRMVKAYGNPSLNLSDYGYLLGIHPVKVGARGN
jgi:hypothetical protein